MRHNFMKSPYYQYLRSTAAVNKVRMHQLTVYVIFSGKIQFLKVVCFTKFQKQNLRKGNTSFWVGPAVGGSVGARQSEQTNNF